MSPSEGFYKLDDANWNRLQELVEKYEKDCLESFPRELSRYLPEAGDPLRHYAFEELIRTDLELRWRHRQRALVEDYLKRYSELTSLDVVTELLYDEFLIRQRFGDQPQLEEYRTRFPAHYATLAKLVGEAATGPEAEPAAGEPVGATFATSGDSGPFRLSDVPEGGHLRKWQELRPPTDGTVRFRPEKRGALPTIVLFDEQGMPGEAIVLRKAKFKIGRTHGDLVVGHDMLISGSHAMLVWKPGTLTLMDEGSRNGTFWRLRPGWPCRLGDGDRFLCGRQLFQIDLQSPTLSYASNEGQRKSGNLSDTSRAEKARLVWLGDHGEAVHEYAVTASAPQTIGRDPRAEICIGNDDFLSPKHARIRYVTAHRAYLLEDLGSFNGVFIKINGPVRLADGDMFRIGEQLIGVLFPVLAKT